jgi:hypothetical protein
MAASLEVRRSTLDDALGNGALNAIARRRQGKTIPAQKPAQLNGLVLPKAQTRFQMDWVWDGKPIKIVSRSTDEKGNVQPDRQSFIAQEGTNALFHYHAQQTWSIDDAGRVRNALA